MSSSNINSGYWGLGDLSGLLGAFNSKKHLQHLLSYFLFIDGSPILH